MPIRKFRENERRNFTKVGNGVFCDNSLTLKEKGLICTLFSLPENWRMSEKGIASCCRDSVSGVRSALRSIEEKGYLFREQSRDGLGQLADTVYCIADSDRFSVFLPCTEKPCTEKPCTENRTANKEYTYKKPLNKYLSDKREKERHSSFDTKDFFEAALRKSYGDTSE